MHLDREVQLRLSVYKTTNWELQYSVELSTSSLTAKSRWAGLFSDGPCSNYHIHNINFAWESVPKAFPGAQRYNVGCAG